MTVKLESNFKHQFMLRLRQEIVYLDTRDEYDNITAEEMIVKVPRDTYKRLCEYALAYLREQENIE